MYQKLRFTWFEDQIQYPWNKFGRISTKQTLKTPTNTHFPEDNTEGDSRSVLLKSKLAVVDAEDDRNKNGITPVSYIALVQSTFKYKSRWLSRKMIQNTALNLHTSAN